MKAIKTVFNRSENLNFEIAKRFIYSFKVLMLAVAFPLLFIIGISNGTKKSQMKL
jgi:hypothetical protein